MFNCGNIFESGTENCSRLRNSTSVLPSIIGRCEEGRGADLPNARKGGAFKKPGAISKGMERRVGIVSTLLTMIDSLTKSKVKYGTLDLIIFVFFQSRFPKKSFSERQSLMFICRFWKRKQAE